ncbi:MAG: MFS transporter [Dehalococcoidia bacterium]
MIHISRGLKGEVLLGALLLATALMVDGSAFSEVAITVAREVLDLSALRSSLVLTAGGVGGLAVVAAAIIVDRRGPHRVMPLALVAGAGLLLLAISGSLWWLIASSIVSGLGMAGVASLILYALAAKGCYRIRGTVIGALALVGGLDLARRVAEPLIDASAAASDWRWVAGGFAALAVAGAALLFTALPRVFPVRRHPETLPQWRPTTEDERGLTGRELKQLPGFRKVVAMVALVFALGGALSTTVHFQLYPVYPDLIPGTGLWWLAPAFGALLWGVASDFVRVRLLIPVVSLVVLLGILLLWLLEGSGADALGAVVMGLALGATRVLPWVLLADHVGVRFFATVGIGVSIVGGILGPPLGGVALALSGDLPGGGIVVLVPLTLAFAVAGFTAPRLSLAEIQRVDSGLA